MDEIFAFGLRNPFSFSFDRGSGLLYLADVGQNKIEEIDIIYRGSNYGWNIKEGSFYFDPNGAGAGYVTTVPVRPVPPDLVDPIAEYDHDDGTAAIGGYVYRGSQVPSLSGRYVFGDWGFFGSPSGRLYYLDAATNILELRIGLTDRPLGQYLKGFGEDASGELYVFTSKGQGPQGNGGIMYKVVPPPAAPVSVSRVKVTNDTFCTTLAGGVGPIVQQRKVSLNEPVWANELFTTGGDTNVPVRNGAGFFRASDTAQQRTVPFTAWISPLNEHPVTASTAEGFGIFGLEGNALTFTITYRGLTGPATQAHFHGPAPAASNAPVLIDLRPYHNGAYAATGSFSGTIILSDLNKARLLAGQIYVNIHTTANTGGEMRGQVAPVAMHASVLGANEIPVVNTPAQALGSFTLIGTQLSFAITYRGLSGNATAAHIHGPAAIGAGASPIIDFNTFTGGVYGSNGVIKGVIGLTPSQLEWVIDGRTYVNFHTAAHGGGEIRGQILPQSTAVPLTAWISGLNERTTPLTNTASGLGILSLEGDTLAFNFHYSGLSGAPIGAHIHGAAATSGNTGIQVDLAPYHNGPYSATSGSFSGSVLLTPAQRNMVLNGQTYFNIHTADKTGGEARGNISSVLMSAYATGTGERTVPLSVSASALGMFTLIHTQLTVNVVYSGLSTPASGAHIHAPANASQNAGVVINFQPFVPAFGSFGGIYGVANVVHTNVNNLIDGLGYMNLHTTNNPGGEVRGQVGR